MRQLTETEQIEIDRRKSGFDQFLEERMPVLKDFMEPPELPNPAMVVAQAEPYLPSIDQWMKDQVVTPDDRVWILTRIGYFIGELLVQRFSGYWYVNDIPDSRFFGRYVVGRFCSVGNPNPMIDPFSVADAYLSQPPGRSLMDIIRQVDAELREYAKE